MSHKQYQEFRNKTIQSVIPESNLSEKQKIRIFREYVQKNILDILLQNKHLYYSDFSFLQKTSQPLDIRRVLSGPEEKIIPGCQIFKNITDCFLDTGKPLGMRATSQEFHSKKILTAGNSGIEGIGMHRDDNKRALHYFIGDARTQLRMQATGVSFDTALRNSVKMCIEVYARLHAGRSWQSMEKYGRFVRNDLPILYFFPAPQVVGSFLYRGLYDSHDGLPTLDESITTHFDIKLKDCFTFTITPQDFLEIDQIVREDLWVDFKETSGYTRKLELEDVRPYTDDIERGLGFYEAVFLSQKYLLNCIPEDQWLQKVTKKEADKFRANPQEFIPHLLQTEQYQNLRNFYFKCLYESFARVIWEKVQRKFLMDI